MGNIDLSKMGLSGKMGPIVAYIVNGKQRFRTFTEPRNPKTAKQTEHRSRFGFVSNKVSPLFAQIKIGYKNNIIAFGTVCGQVNREAVIGTFPDLKIDYSKIQIAEGKLKPLSMVTLKIDRSEEHTSELQSRRHLVCRLLLEKKRNTKTVERNAIPKALLCLIIDNTFSFNYDISETSASITNRILHDITFTCMISYATLNIH